jgi:hypothetical protein
MSYLCEDIKKITPGMMLEEPLFSRIDTDKIVRVLCDMLHYPLPTIWATIRKCAEKNLPCDIETVVRELIGEDRPIEENGKCLDVNHVNNRCILCLSNTLQSVCIPCGHISMCGDCNANITKCPICGLKKMGSMKIYLP